ncbi:hypothetical protein [Salipiger profundus]|jgi:hypothetical protein|nr:hypothetical protein [Salipiger profundus]SFB86904.1 hypothetical protein SAMN05444415_101239 [Salipiger profundus]
MTRRTGLLPSNRRHAPRRLPGLAAPMLAALALAGCERLPLLAFLQPATDASESETMPPARDRLPCGATPAQTLSCPYRVMRSDDGRTVVLVAIPGGPQRILEFRNGALVSSDAPSVLETAREGDGLRVTVGGAEHYLIADEILRGG